MSGFNALEQELDALKNEGFSVAPRIEEAVQDYQRQAEEAEQLVLNQQANERQSETKEESVKQR